MDCPAENRPVLANIPKSWFQKLAFRKLMSLPCWGRRYSYIIVETDPAQKVECIRAFEAQATIERRWTVLKLHPGQRPPATIDDAVAALMQIYHRDVDDYGSLESSIRETNESALKDGWTRDELSKISEGQQKLIDWMHILKAAPTKINELLAAWNRLEHDQIYQEVN